MRSDPARDLDHRARSATPREPGRGARWRAPWVAAVALLAACAGPRGTAPRPPPPQRTPVTWGDPARVEKLAAAAAELEPLVAEFAAASKVPGMAVGLVSGGRLLWFVGKGVRDVATGAPVDADTAFRIASMSKAFVAAAVLRLRDEGKLSLDDPAERYLPELRSVAYPTADSPRITVRHLLSHAAGLPEDNATADLRMPMSEADFDALLARGLSFSSAPGTEFEYSNLGFALAGRVVARVSGLRAQDYITRNLLAPLAMQETRWDARDVPDERRARGYGRKGSVMPSAGLAKYEDDAPHEEPVLGDGAWAPLGGLWTSARDYARWVAFQLAAWPPRDGPDDGAVRRASIRETHEVHRTIAFDATRDDDGHLEVAAGGYGFGWGVRATCRFARAVRHTGGLPGHGSVVLLLPEHDVGVFVMTNLTYTTGASLATALVNGLEARGALPARPRTLSPQLERARAGVLELLASWDAQRAASLFDANHASYEPPDRLRARLERFRAAHGACRPSPEAHPENALRGRLRLDCERGALWATVELTSDAPPRMQTLVLESALPPSAPLARAASGAARLLARWDERAAGALLAPGADRNSTRKAFARVAADQGPCRPGAPVAGDGTTTARYRLPCERGEVDLEIDLDPASARAARVSARAAPGSVRCPR